MISHATLILLVLGADPARPHDNGVASFDDFLSLYHQTVANFPALRVTFRITGGSLREYREWQRQRMARAEQEWQTLPLAERQATENDYRQAMKTYAERIAEPTTQYREEITIEKSPNGIEIKRQVPEDPDKQEEEAKMRGIESATGGRYYVYRLDRTQTSMNWTAIDPFPFIRTTQPVYTRYGTRLPLMVPVLPPLFNSDALYETLCPDLHSLYFPAGQPDESRQAVPVSAESGKYLLSVKERMGTFVASSMSLHRGGIPDWIARFDYTSNSPGLLDGGALKRLAEVIPAYRREPKVVRPDYASPIQAAWFEDWKKVGEDLEYPRTTVLRRFSRATDPIGGEETQVVVPIDEFRLEVLSIELMHDAATRSYFTTVPDGARLIDAEMGRSTIVGQPDDGKSMLAKLSETQTRRDRYRQVLIWINVAGVVFLVTLIYWKRRRARVLGASTKDSTTA